MNGAPPGLGTSDRAHLYPQASTLRLKEIRCLTQGYPPEQLGDGTQVSQPSFCTIQKCSEKDSQGQRWGCLGNCGFVTFFFIDM